MPAFIALYRVVDSIRAFKEVRPGQVACVAGSRPANSPWARTSADCHPAGSRGQRSSRPVWHAAAQASRIGLDGAWSRPSTRTLQDHVFRGRSDGASGPRPPNASHARRPALTVRSLTATHYENFSVVTWLTPREHRPAFQSIYAFCRWSDDLGDEVGDPARSLELAGLVAWRAAGHVPGPGASSGHDRPGRDRRAATRSRSSPSRRSIDAFVQDQTVTEYLTYSQLARLLHAVGQPGGTSGAPRGRCVSPPRTPGCPTRRARRCNWRTSGRTWPATWRSAGSTCPREDRERFGYPDDRSAGAAVHAGVRRADEVRGRADARDCSTQGGPGAADSRRAGRRYRPVLAGRPGDPGSDRGPRVRRPDGSPRADRSGPRSACWDEPCLASGWLDWRCEDRASGRVSAAFPRRWRPHRARASSPLESLR